MKITINRCSNRFNLELQNENLSILQLNFDLYAEEEGLKKKRKERKTGEINEIKVLQTVFHVFGQGTMPFAIEDKTKS